jgi:hypothetical protein
MRNMGSKTCSGITKHSVLKICCKPLGIKGLTEVELMRNADNAEKISFRINNLLKLRAYLRFC